MTEKQLIKRCQQNDPIAQQKLYESYAPKMFGICCRYAIDRDTAQDMLHDGFITVFAKIGTFRDEGSFEGWLRRVFVNTALGHLRKHTALDNADHVDTVKTFDNSEISVVESMEARDIISYISQLPDGYRAVLNMFAVEGYSHKEIAETLGISEGTSRSQYARAKNYLHRLLKHAEII